MPSTTFQIALRGLDLPGRSCPTAHRAGDLNQACNYIETLKDSEYNDYRLIYEDLRCWNAKLKTLSAIALTALDLLENDGSMSRAEGWEKYLSLQQLYNGMSNDSTYLISALEGYGTSTYEVHYEVTPGDSYLRPFVEYLVGKAGNNVPEHGPKRIPFKSSPTSRVGKG